MHVIPHRKWIILLCQFPPQLALHCQNVAPLHITVGQISLQRSQMHCQTPKCMNCWFSVKDEFYCQGVRYLAINLLRTLNPFWIGRCWHFKHIWLQFIYTHERHSKLEIYPWCYIQCYKKYASHQNLFTMNRIQLGGAQNSDYVGTFIDFQKHHTSHIMAALPSQGIMLNHILTKPDGFWN